MTIRLMHSQRPFVRRVRATVYGFIFMGLLATPAFGELFKAKVFTVTKTSNVQYTTVTLNTGGAPVPITLDVYSPDDGGLLTKPGFIMIHGGGFALFSKDGDAAEFPPGKFINSSITEYATELAKRGYVCVSINYPKLFDYSVDGTVFANGTGFYSGIGADTTAIAAALNATLAFVGLPSPISETAIINTLEGAIQTAVDAVDWMVAEKVMLGVDESRIAIGGYSAGATMAFLAGNINPKVRAIWLNSGGFASFPNLLLSPGGPPVIAFHGDSDIIVDVTLARAIRDELVNNSIPHQYFEMAGEDHFYFINRTVTQAPTKAVPDTIENLIQDFMFTQMDLATLGGAFVPASEPGGLAVLVGLCLLFGVVYLLRRKHAR